MFRTQRHGLVTPCLSFVGRASAVVRPPLHDRAAALARAHDRAGAADKKMACCGKRKACRGQRMKPLQKSKNDSPQSI